MAKQSIKAGATDWTIDIFIQDASSVVGAGLSGLVFNSGGLLCYYRKGATGAATQLTLATQTVGGAHSDGGFVEVQATNMKGVYRLDLSDTIVATAQMVTVYLYGATNMVPVIAELEVVSYDPFNLAESLALWDWTTVVGTVPARCALNALRFLRNKWSISGTTLTVTKEDDTTAAWTGTVTPTVGADPITGVDPA